MPDRVGPERSYLSSKVRDNLHKLIKGRNKFITLAGKLLLLLDREGYTFPELRGRGGRATIPSINPDFGAMVCLYPNGFCDKR